MELSGLGAYILKEYKLPDFASHPFKYTYNKTGNVRTT
jgi:hypothetical protein